MLLDSRNKKIIEMPSFKAFVVGPLRKELP
jgi:hypothetical protein